MDINNIHNRAKRTTQKQRSCNRTLHRRKRRPVYNGRRETRIRRYLSLSSNWNSNSDVHIMCIARKEITLRRLERL